MDGIAIANLDSVVVKNLATGKSLSVSTLCKGTQTIIKNKILEQIIISI